MNSIQHFLRPVDPLLRTRVFLVQGVQMGVITAWFIACTLLKVAPVGELFGGYAVMLCGVMSYPSLWLKKEASKVYMTHIMGMLTY